MPFAVVGYGDIGQPPCGPVGCLPLALRAYCVPYRRCPCRLTLRMTPRTSTIGPPATPTTPHPPPRRRPTSRTRTCASTHPIPKSPHPIPTIAQKRHRSPKSPGRDTASCRKQTPTPIKSCRLPLPTQPMAEPPPSGVPRDLPRAAIIM